MALQTKNDLTLERSTLVECVRRFGGHASDAALDPTRKIFSLPFIEGIISYHVALGCAVVFGDPICEPENKEHLAEAFRRHCEQQNLRSIYLSASKSFAMWATKQANSAIVEFGEELFIDPYDDPRNKTGENASLVRRKVKHALSENVIVNEYLEDDPQIEKALEKVGSTWLASRQGPQIHTSQVRLFDNRLGKRWLYAMQDQKMIGVLVLNELQEKKGWLLNRYMVTDDAPGGTPELLVISAIERLSLEECHYLSFGVVPATTLGEIKGFNQLSTQLARLIFHAARYVFHLDGRRKFWEKFHPQMESSFIVFNQSSLSLRDIVSILRALNAA